MTALFFLLLAVGISVVGCTIVYLRQRPPRSVESGIESFQRGVQALASRPGPERDDAARGVIDGEERVRLRHRLRRR